MVRMAVLGVSLSVVGLGEGQAVTPMQEKMQMMWELVAESENVQRDEQGQEAELSPHCLITEHLDVSSSAPVHELPRQ